MVSFLLKDLLWSYIFNICFCEELINIHYRDIFCTFKVVKKTKEDKKGISDFLTTTMSTTTIEGKESILTTAITRNYFNRQLHKSRF